MPISCAAQPMSACKAAAAMPPVVISERSQRRQCRTACARPERRFGFFRQLLTHGKILPPTNISDFPSTVPVCRQCCPINLSVDEGSLKRATDTTPLQPSWLSCQPLVTTSPSELHFCDELTDHDSSAACIPRHWGRQIDGSSSCTLFVH